MLPSARRAAAAFLITSSLNGSGGGVKYEDVYINDYDSVNAALCGLKRYFNFYNRRQLHQSLNYQTPYPVYFQ
jgi:hypothetical protein